MTFWRFWFSSWEIMRIRGIPLRIDSSWILFFFYFTWITEKGRLDTLLNGNESIGAGWLISFFALFLWFVSLLAHELAHSFVAFKEGAKVHNITLSFIGGFANLEKECSTSKGSLKIALSGPIVSILVGAFMIILGNFLSGSLVIFSNLLKLIGGINLLVVLINLIPVLPLDGGVILKSLIWDLTGSKRTGIKVAIKSARVISLFCIFVGFILLIKGIIYLAFPLLIMGIFVFSSSKSQSQIIQIQKILSELYVNQVCSRSYRVLEDDLPVKVLSKYNSLNKDNVFSEEWILLFREGRWVGYVNEKILKNISVQNWDKKFLYEFSFPKNELPSISEKEALWKAIIKIEKIKDGRLIVLSASGLPLGTLDRVDIGKAVLNKIGLNLPDQLIKIARKENIYPIGLNLHTIAKSMISSDLEENQK